MSRKIIEIDDVGVIGDLANVARAQGTNVRNLLENWVPEIWAVHIENGRARILVRDYDGTDRELRHALERALQEYGIFQYLPEGALFIYDEGGTVLEDTFVETAKTFSFNVGSGIAIALVVMVLVGAFNGIRS